ncbi:unnamed protein product [Oikopleura dioica]|uniref:Uncharacterized protein n=1 Tax=Oikopleura dioica TaxID=34765 RepID=E4X6S1_OIKDI|nr:unnamed protein product [Oikopleura dioica]
MSSGLQHWLL